MAIPFGLGGAWLEHLPKLSIGLVLRAHDFTLCQEGIDVDDTGVVCYLTAIEKAKSHVISCPVKSAFHNVLF
jgi:hypothetical protein